MRGKKAVMAAAMLGCAAQFCAAGVEPSIVVTATRTRQPMHDTAYYADIVTEDEIRMSRMPRTVPECLRDQTGVLVQKTGHGQGSPYIRGLTSYHTLMMVDSIRLNNSVFRSGPNQYWNTIDPFALNQLEIVKGPSSSLYGSDSVGGTVNAISQMRKDYPDGLNWDRRAYYRYSTAENSHIARGEVSGNLDDKVGLLMGYTFKSFGDLEGGADVGTQEKTGYDEMDWNMRLDYFPNEDSQVTFAHQGMGMDDAWRTHKTIYGIDWEGLTVGKELERILDQERYLTYLQYRQQDPCWAVDELSLGVSHHYQGEERNRVRTGKGRDQQGFTVHTIGTFAQLKSESDYGDWTYGFEYYRDSVDSYKEAWKEDGTYKGASIQGPVGDDSTYDLAGAYVQNTMGLNDRFDVTLGARYDYAAADSDKVQDPDTGDEISVSGDWGAFVGNARGMYAIDDAGQYRAFCGVSQGFRAPNLSDLTRLDSARTDEIETPAPDLDPETYIAYEIGAKAETDSMRAQCAYFYTDINDMIVRTPTGQIVDGDNEVTKQNAGDGYVHGVEIEGQVKFSDNWTLFGSATWMEGEVDTYPTSDPVLVREPIDRSNPLSGKAGLRWDYDRYWVEAQVRAAEKADRLSTRDESDTSRIPPGGTPGYTVFDVRAGWNPTDDLKLSLSIENLTDEDFRIHGSGLNEPGLNAILAADWTF